MASNEFYEKSGDKVQEISDLSDFTKEFVDLYKGEGTGLYFRGQQNSDWALLPSAGREHSFAEKTIEPFTVE